MRAFSFLHSPLSYLALCLSCRLLIPPFLPFLIPALEPAEHEAAAQVRDGAVDVHGGGAAEALPADARVHAPLQRPKGRGRHRQGQARVSGDLKRESLLGAV